MLGSLTNGDIAPLGNVLVELVVSAANVAWKRLQHEKMIIIR